MAVINLTLPYPISANRYWRTNGNGHVYVSEEAQDYKSDIALLARKVKPVEGDVALTVRIYRPQRSGDLSNRIKVLEDALEGIAYINDKQITELHAYRFDDKKNPRAEVEIVSLGANGSHQHTSDGQHERFVDTGGRAVWLSRCIECGLGLTRRTAPDEVQI